jgi:hypothetical protein
MSERNFEERFHLEFVRTLSDTAERVYDFETVGDIILADLATKRTAVLKYW